MNNEMTAQQQIRATAVKAVYWSAPIISEDKLRQTIEQTAYYITFGKWEKHR